MLTKKLGYFNIGDIVTIKCPYKGFKEGDRFRVVDVGYDWLLLSNQVYVSKSICQLNFIQGK